MATMAPRLPLPACGERSTAEGGRVRGALRADGSCYDFKNTVHIFQNIMIPETQDAIVVLGQPSIADAIHFAVSVLSAIDLNNHTRFPTDEIDDVGTNWLLANKLSIFDRPRA
jgi:hypothetical protein